jgi:transcriptional regulator with GAF, ATPase, and Fis domain
MDKQGVWLASFLGRDQSMASSVGDALAAAGLPVVERGRRAAERPGVVLVDALTTETVAAVRGCSQQGDRRVLVVADPGGLDADSVWRLLHLGASDVITWIGHQTAEDVAARLSRWAEVDMLVDSPMLRRHLVGRSPTWRSALRRVVEAARFTDSSVLITGESGTGKELTARLVHDLDTRPDKGELVVVDCTTVVPTLSGSEFFGHERGAFTGAVATRQGAFARANRGTLFLDEVGELPLPLQAELLRVVQEGTYKRVGSDVWRHTGFRLVCATNRDLGVEQASGTFRRDLYYRIAAATVRLPPLRERIEDVLPLFQHFLAQLLPAGATAELDPVVRQLLLGRAYPGNVRDLRQLALRVSNRHVGPGPVTAGDLPEEERPLPGRPTGGSRPHQGDVPGSGLAAGSDPDPAAVPQAEQEPDWENPARRAIARGSSLRELREAAADAAVRVAIEDAGGNLRRAAATLGVTDRALQLRRAERRDGHRPVPARHH